MNKKGEVEKEEVESRRQGDERMKVHEIAIHIQKKKTFL